MSAAWRVSLVLLGGCAAAIPPTQSSIGAMANANGVAIRGSAGAHAKAADRTDRLDVDVGAGYVFEHAETMTAHGTYIALARRLPLGGRRDLWLGGRFEQFWRADMGEPSRGLNLRLALRHHVGGVAAGSSDGSGAAGIYGALAVGAHADVGVRTLEGGGAAVMLSAGLSLDLPALFGAASR